MFHIKTNDAVSIEMNHYAKELIMEAIRDQLKITSKLKQSTGIVNNELAVIPIDADILGNNELFDSLIKFHHDLRKENLLSHFEGAYFSYDLDLDGAIDSQLAVTKLLSEKIYAIIDVTKLQNHNWLSICAFFNINYKFADLYTPVIEINRILQPDPMFIWSRGSEVLDLLYVYSTLHSRKVGVKRLEVILPMISAEYGTKEAISDESRLSDGTSHETRFTYRVTDLIFSRPSVTKDLSVDSYWNIDFLPFSDDTWVFEGDYNVINLTTSAIAVTKIETVDHALNSLAKGSLRISTISPNKTERERRQKLIAVLNTLQSQCLVIYHNETNQFCGSITYRLIDKRPIEITSINCDAKDYKVLAIILNKLLHMVKDLQGALPLCVYEHQGQEIDPTIDALTTCDFNITATRVVKEISYRDYDEAIDLLMED